MIVTPPTDIPIIQDDLSISPGEVLQGIKEWAKGNMEKYSLAFLICDGDPKKESSYQIPIGWVTRGVLVSSPGSLLMAEKEACKLPEPYRGQVLRELSRFVERIGRVPEAGNEKYYQLVEEEDRTPRLLEGPHERAGLRPNEKRWVVFDENGEIVLGPRHQKS